MLLLLLQRGRGASSTNSHKGEASDTHSELAYYSVYMYVRAHVDLPAVCVLV